MRYKIHFAKSKDPSKAWVIQEIPDKDNPVPSTYYASAVELFGFCRLMEMNERVEPQAWLEIDGFISLDGNTNTVQIRSSTAK